ncbi:MAG: hypothetical protein ACFFBD_06265, partial [Candidatus Hodarchaeota archaeon]
MNIRKMYFFSLLLGLLVLSSISFSTISASSFPYSFDGGHFAVVVDLNTDGTDYDIRKDVENGTT